MRAPDSVAQPRLPMFSLLLLAAAVFCMVTSEFLPTGILPQLSRDLGSSTAQTGLLVTIFAATVVVSTVPVATLTRSIPRKPYLIAMLAVFVLASLLAAVAPTYGVLVIARVIGGIAHGQFWTIVNPYAARLVPQAQLARAIAITGAGGTGAFVFGVPLGTALGQAVGWRLAFAVLAGAIVVLGALIVWKLPPVQHLVPMNTAEIALAGRRTPAIAGVLAVCGVVVLVMVGQNAFYTYIAPWLIQQAGIPEASVSIVLFLYGGGGAIGLLLAGIFGDRAPRAALLVMLAAVPVAVAGLALATDAPAGRWIAFAAWSIAVGGLPSLLQTRAMRVSGPRLSDFASAAVTTAFNAAIGGGALLGSLLLTGFGLTVLPWTLVVFVAAGLVACLLVVRERRVAVSSPAPAG